MAMLGSVFSLLGSMVSAAGTIAAGRAQQEAANMEALQMENEAKERQAAAAVEMQEQRREKQIAQSTLQARAAASGFTANDPGTIALLDEITRYGTYKEQLALYGGATDRSKLDYSAHIKRKSGEAAMKAARASAMGTILGGFASFAKGSFGSYRPQGIYG